MHLFRRLTLSFFLAWAATLGACFKTEDEKSAPLLPDAAEAAVAEKCESSYEGMRHLSHSPSGKPCAIYSAVDLDSFEFFHCDVLAITRRDGRELLLPSFLECERVAPGVAGGAKCEVDTWPSRDVDAGTDEQVESVCALSVLPCAEVFCGFLE